MANRYEARQDGDVWRVWDNKRGCWLKASERRRHGFSTQAEALGYVTYRVHILDKLTGAKA